MQPHQLRVVEEKQELDDKLTKLDSFITDSPVFKNLDKIDQELLTVQRGAMQEYSTILQQRIDRF